MHSISHDATAESSSTSTTKDNIKRRVTSPGRTSSDLVQQFNLSPYRARTLPSRRPILQAADDSSPTAQSLIRTVRYEDVQESDDTDVSRASPSNRILSISRKQRKAIRSEYRSNPELPHIPEYFDVDQLSISPTIDSKTPKKGSPSFASKRRSISGSFNSLRRAGTKLVRRGVQGVLPITPSKKSESSPQQTSDIMRYISDDDGHEKGDIAIDLQSSQRLDGYTPPKIGVMSDVFRPRRSILCGINGSDDTARTFYDAQESLTMTSELPPVIIKSVIAIPAVDTSIKPNQLVPSHDLPSTPAEEACNKLSGQFLEQEASAENIIERINRRQSIISFSERHGLERHIGRRFSRSTFVPPEASRDTSLVQLSDHEPTTTSQSLLGQSRMSEKSIIGTEPKIREILKRMDRVTGADTRTASNTLFDMVREHLDFDEDESLGAIVVPAETMRVSTRGVYFRNAHKNYFPVWASQLKRNGRPYRQEEVVRKILGST